MSNTSTSEKSEVIRDESQLPGKSEDDLLLTKAVEWVKREARPVGECPFCGRDFHLTDSAKPNLLEFVLHLKSQHPSRVMVAYSSRDLEVAVKNDEDVPAPGDWYGLAGLQVVEDLDRPDLLFIDPKVKERLKKQGGQLRWCAPAKVAHFKAQGAKVIEREKDQALGKGVEASREDSTVRTNEMVLLEIPQGLWDRRKRQKAARVDDQLQACKEDIQKNVDALEQTVYDGMIKQGVDKQTARQVSSAIAKNARSKEEGDWRGASGSAHGGVQIRRGFDRGNIREI